MPHIDAQTERRQPRMLNLSRRGLTITLGLFLTLAAAALLAAACGGGDDSSSATKAPSGNTFDITMGDNFYKPNQVTVKAGDKITFNLKNNGAAIHNMRIAGADNQYNTADDQLSEMVIQAGQASKFEWTAPTKAGLYNFRCDYHPTDSVGTFTIE
jgi:plastocyanin